MDSGAAHPGDAVIFVGAGPTFAYDRSKRRQVLLIEGCTLHLHDQYKIACDKAGILDPHESPTATIGFDQDDFLVLIDDAIDVCLAEGGAGDTSDQEKLEYPDIGESHTAKMGLMMNNNWL